MGNMCEIKEKLEDIVLTVLENEVSEIDTHELGEVIDMIKDMAEAIEKCKKAKYYTAIVTAMEEADTETLQTFKNNMYLTDTTEEKELENVEAIIEAINKIAEQSDSASINVMKQKIMNDLSQL